MAKVKYNTHIDDALKAQSKFLRGDVTSSAFGVRDVKGLVDKAIISAVTIPAIAIIANFDQIMAHAKLAGAVLGVVAGSFSASGCGNGPTTPAAGC
jgi:hypothetical protein